MPNIVKVLVVDDSAYVRKVVRQMLLRSPFIEVAGAARDGTEALELVEEQRPDVVTCDLNMPQMDGVAFVRAQMARQPVPIIIISIASHAGEQVLAALGGGARAPHPARPRRGGDRHVDGRSASAALAHPAAARRFPGADRDRAAHA